MICLLCNTFFMLKKRKKKVNIRAHYGGGKMDYLDIQCLKEREEERNIENVRSSNYKNRRTAIKKNKAACTQKGLKSNIVRSSLTNKIYI